MKKTCPRCTAEFVCRVDAIEFCQCRMVNLSPGVRDHIKREYGACLCLQCLKEMNEKFGSSVF